VHRWLKRNDDYKANGRDNIEMAFMYSECGNEWTEVRENNGNVFFCVNLVFTFEINFTPGLTFNNHQDLVSDLKFN